ncbi:hypothetical protein ACODT3_41255 [Streptomyces sp. 4.24]|uniref:hypothetical protein n=1 Tax=Streptomyces tritrimontium TaxID=3406573 RepID=UPI003BB7BFD0
MSTPRRVLGTGPSSTTRSTPTSFGPRLLPVERAEQEQLLEDDVEHGVVQMLRGRRNLGPGFASTSEGVVGK